MATVDNHVGQENLLDGDVDNPETTSKQAVHAADDSADEVPLIPDNGSGLTLRFYSQELKRVVFYAVRVHSLSNISNIEQSFDCSFDITMQWMAEEDEMEKYIEDNREGNPVEIGKLEAKLKNVVRDQREEEAKDSRSTRADKEAGRKQKEEEKENGQEKMEGMCHTEMFKKGLFMLKQLADKQIGTKPTKNMEIWKPPEIRFPTLMEHTQDPEDHGLEHIVVGDSNKETPSRSFQFKEKRSYNCRFRERMELESFPFDVQSFSIKLRFPVSTAEAHFVPLPGTFIEVEKMHNLSEFEMKQPLFIQDTETVRDFEFDQILTKENVDTFTTIDIKLKGVRNWRAYFYRIFVLSFLIALTLLLVFVTPADEVADRLAHGVTILLTMVAFQFVVQTLLPQLGYLTFMDSYLLGADVYISIVIIAACVPQLLAEWEFIDGPGFLDSVFFALSFAALIVISIAQCLYVKFKLIPKEQEKLSKWRDDVQSTAFTVDFGEQNKRQEMDSTEPEVVHAVDEKFRARIESNIQRVPPRFAIIKKVDN